MTNPDDTNESPSTEQASEDHSHESQNHEPWDRDASEFEEPDPDEFTDPPDKGADYYRQLINLESCSYSYIKKGRILQFSWSGEIHDMDEFRDGLYQLYVSTYKSDLAAAELRPKAFYGFGERGFSEEFKNTLRGQVSENPIHTQTPGRNTTRMHKRIANILTRAGTLACEHREKPSHRRQGKDAVLESVLPDAVRSQSS